MQKARVQQALDASPDDFELDAFMEKVYLLRKIEIGEEQISSGKCVPHEDAKKRLEKWLA